MQVFHERGLVPIHVNDLVQWGQTSTFDNWIFPKATPGALNRRWCGGLRSGACSRARLACPLGAQAGDRRMGTGGEHRLHIQTRFAWFNRLSAKGAKSRDGRAGGERKPAVEVRRSNLS